MVLRCSLLGHDFGDTEVEREREERGSEVVVTVQEFEACSRCGERNVISENTEVTTLAVETDTDSLPDDHEPEPTAPPLEPDATAETTAETDAAFVDADDPVAESNAEFVDADADDSDSGTDAARLDTDDPAVESDAEFIDADEPDSEPEAEAELIDDDDTAATPPDRSAATTAPVETAATDDTDLPTDENGDPVVDDGEILEDDEPAPEHDREHGEWPDSSDVGPPVDADSSPSTWPDDADADTDADTETDPEDAASDPTPPDDDAVVLDNDVPADTTTDARSVTATPPTDPDDDAHASPESASGIEWAESVPTPTERESGPTDDVPTEFYCPRCDYVAAGDRASLRAGDICPDCRKGYLTERERR